MKRFLLTTILLSSIFLLKAQTVDWARQASDAGVSSALGVSSDGVGNLFVAGIVTPPSVLDSITLPTFGGYDGYVAKYDRNGAIQWAISLGGSDNDYAAEIATDYLGNSFVTGWVGSSAMIGTNLYNFSYNVNFFVLKVNTSGVIQWVKFFNNSGGLSEGKAIAVDGSGLTVAVSGFFQYSADLDSIHITGNYEDAFTAKLNGQTGNVDWVRTGGGFSDDEGQGVALDGSMNVIASGYYKTSATFDGLTFPSGSGHDIYLIKYDNNGSIIWGKYAIGPGQDDGYKIKTDNYNNIYLEGLYEAGVDFDGNVLTSVGSYDAYLNKYDPNGNLKWIIHGGGPSPSVEVFSGFTFDNYGYLWCTGYFTGAAVIDTFQVNVQGSEIVLCRIDTSGQILNVLTYGGAGDDYGQGLAYVPECYIAVGGSFSSTGSFGSLSMTSGGSEDACVIHIDATCTIGIHEQNKNSNITVYPTPFSSYITINSSGRIENGILRIYNSLGSCVLQKSIAGSVIEMDLSDLPKGLYNIQVTSDKDFFNKQIVKQ
jgi:hypothetical protein